MGRVIAIDYGKKRCGIAVSDPLKIIASPLETVNTDILWAFLQQYVGKEVVDTMVVGLPLDDQNKQTDITKEVLTFVHKLKKKFATIEITTIDERYTSKMAKQAIFEMNLSKKKRQDKKIVDRVAAAIFLRDYLSMISPQSL